MGINLSLFSATYLSLQLKDIVLMGINLSLFSATYLSLQLKDIVLMGINLSLFSATSLSTRAVLVSGLPSVSKYIASMS